jgi:hypothetical protein
MEQWWNNDKQGKTEDLQENFAPVPLRLPQISREVADN